METIRQIVHVFGEHPERAMQIPITKGEAYLPELARQGRGGRRDRSDPVMRQLTYGLGVELVAVTASGAEAVAPSYRACRLMFVGENLGGTDIRRATGGMGGWGRSGQRRKGSVALRRSR